MKISICESIHKWRYRCVKVSVYEKYWCMKSTDIWIQVSIYEIIDTWNYQCMTVQTFGSTDIWKYQSTKISIYSMPYNRKNHTRNYIISYRLPTLPPTLTPTVTLSPLTAMLSSTLPSAPNLQGSFIIRSSPNQWNPYSLALAVYRIQENKGSPNNTNYLHRKPETR